MTQRRKSNPNSGSTLVLHDPKNTDNTVQFTLTLLKSTFQCLGKETIPSFRMRLIALVLFGDLKNYIIDYIILDVNFFCQHFISSSYDLADFLLASARAPSVRKHLLSTLVKQSQLLFHVIETNETQNKKTNGN